MMMTKKSTQIKKVCKKLALIPIIAGLLFAFSNRAEAQNVKKMSTQQLTKTMTRLKATDSLLARKMSKLNAFMAKMNKELRSNSKTAVRKAIKKRAMKLKEVRIHRKKKLKKARLQQTKELKKAKKQQEKERKKAHLRLISAKYSALIQMYMAIKPTKKNRKEMESVYKNIRSIYNKWNKAIEAKLGKKLAAPPQNPDAMIDKNVSL